MNRYIQLYNVFVNLPGHGWSFLSFYWTGERMRQHSSLRRSAMTQRCHYTVSCWTTTTAPTVRWRRRTQHTDKLTFVPAKERSAMTWLGSLPVSFTKPSKLPSCKLRSNHQTLTTRLWPLWWVFHFSLRMFTARQQYFGLRWWPINCFCRFVVMEGSNQVPILGSFCHPFRY